MANLDYRVRERIVLFAGAAAVSLLALVLVAEIAGNHVGSAVGKLVSVTLLFYFSARIAGHAKTLEEQDVHARLGRLAWIGAPLIFFVLVIQTIGTATPHITFSGYAPSLHIGLWTRITWTADIAVFSLFLVTCMAVWVLESNGLPRLLTRMAYALIGLLTGLLLIAVWASLLVFVHHPRLIVSLFVLSLAGTVLVAILRRIERLDEPGSPDTPAGPQPPAPAAPIATLTPQP